MIEESRSYTLHGNRWCLIRVARLASSGHKSYISNEVCQDRARCGAVPSSRCEVLLDTSRDREPLRLTPVASSYVIKLAQNRRVAPGKCIIAGGRGRGRKINAIISLRLAGKEVIAEGKRKKKTEREKERERERSEVRFRVLNIFAPFPWVGLRLSKGSPANVAWI